MNKLGWVLYCCEILMFVFHQITYESCSDIVNSVKCYQMIYVGCFCCFRIIWNDHLGVWKVSIFLFISSFLSSPLAENLDNMVPDKLYSSYHYSHPPLVERLRAIYEMEKKGWRCLTCLLWCLVWDVLMCFWYVCCECCLFVLCVVYCVVLCNMHYVMDLWLLIHHVVVCCAL